MSDIQPIAPHGGTLIDLLVTGDAADALRAEAANLPTLTPNERELSDLEMLAVGALSPLTGFQGEADYHSVLDTMHLTDGLAWAIPVVLGVDEADAHRLGSGGSVAILAGRGGEPIAVLRVTETFKRDKAKEAVAVYRTDERGPPGRGGRVRRRATTAWPARSRCSRCRPHDDFAAVPPDARRRPAPSSRERGWRTVVGFQTRNPIHRAHEYIQKCALEIVDGLLVHPLVGATKADDVPPDVRMRCYEALFEGYYPKDRAMVSVFPAAMRYAGPREAIWHAICRKNYGCTHFIVGRDHAGVGLVLRHLRRAEDLRGVRAGRAGHHAAELRALVLVQPVRGDGVAEDLPARRGDPRVAVGHEGPRDAGGRRAPAAGVLAARGGRHPDRGDAPRLTERPAARGVASRP